MKKVLSIILSLIMIISTISLIPFEAFANESGQCGENLSYEYDSSTDTLTISGTGDMQDYNWFSSPFEGMYPSKIVIEEGVTSIGDCAFQSCDWTREISIAGTVEKIGSYAISYCYSLEYITIPGSVTTIENNAFYSDYGLTSLILPDSVTEVGDNAFASCSSIESVTLSKNLTKIPESMFSGCVKLSEISIPYGVKEIGQSAFFDAVSLERVEIPESVTSIGFGAFSGCAKLTEITIPSSVNIVNTQAFRDCSALTKITIENPFCVIGTNYYALRKETIPDNATIYGYEYSEARSFAEQYEKKFVSIGNYCELNDHTFSKGKCTLCNAKDPSYVITTNSSKAIETDSDNELTYVADIDGRVRFFAKGNTMTYGWIYDENNSILTYDYSCNYEGENFYLEFDVEKGKSFTLCSETFEENSTVYLERVYSYELNEETGLLTISGTGALPNDNYIPGMYFRGDERIKEVVIEEGITSIGTSQFEDCKNLTSVSIPSSVTSIGECAFGRCEKLTSVSVPGSVENMGYSIFEKCTALKSVTLGTGLKEIGIQMFVDCENLESVSIPATVTLINDRAFQNCRNLKSVSIPTSVTKIGKSAFTWCFGLETVYYGGMPIEWKRIEIEDSNEGLTNADIQYVIEAHEHTYESVVIKEPTCSRTGIKALSCTFCGIEQEREEIPIDSNNHNFINGFCTYCQSKDPSFIIPETNGNETDSVSISDGKKYYLSFTPSVNGTITFYSTGNKDTYGYLYKLQNDKLTFITGDDEGGEKNNFKIVCKIDAGTEYILCLKYYSDSDSGDITYSVEFEPEHTHSFVPRVTTEPTCTQEGVMTYECECKKDSYTEPIPKTDHISGAAVKENQVSATCTAQGSYDEVVRCKNCGVIIKSTHKTVKATGHKEVVVKGTPATFKAAGKTDGKKCNVCGKVTVAQKKIAKLGAPSLIKVTAGKKQFTAKWGSVKSIDGYQIQYSTSSSFKSGNKTVTVSGYKSTSKAVTKLTAKKKYYVRIRGYKTINGKKQYSAWSAKKTVTTKK